MSDEDRQVDQPSVWVNDDKGRPRRYLADAVYEPGTVVWLLSDGIATKQVRDADPAARLGPVIPPPASCHEWWDPAGCRCQRCVDEAARDEENHRGPITVAELIAKLQALTDKQKRMPIGCTYDSDFGIAEVRGIKGEDNVNVEGKGAQTWIMIEGY